MESSTTFPEAEEYAEDPFLCLLLVSLRLRKCPDEFDFPDVDEEFLPDDA